MKTPIHISLLLCFSILISGCNITEDEKAELAEAKIDVEKIADQVIITYPANDATISTSNTVVRADIPADAEAQEVILYVDGIEAARDSDGFPWEINWPAYYWADGTKHTLLLKTITKNGTEVRNTQQHQVTVSRNANEYLEIQDLNSSFIETNTTTIVFEEFPNATSYDIRYIGNGETVEINTLETSVDLENLETGSYEVSYRAKQVYSSSTTLTGPWSSVLSFDVGIYTKRFDGSGDDSAKDILTTKNGEYIVLASTTSKGDSQGDDWIFKLDQKGDIVWEYVYNQSGSSKLRELVELSDGSIFGYGYHNNHPALDGKGLLLNSTGNIIWDKTYTNHENNQVEIKGAVDINGTLYTISGDRNCSLDGYTTICSAYQPKLNTVNLLDGSLTSSIQITELNGALWDTIGSFTTTTSGDLLLGFSVYDPECSANSYEYGCYGGGIATVNLQGNILHDWNSLNEYSFGSGYNAVEAKNGKFALIGDDAWLMGRSFGLFDSNTTHLGTYYSDYYNLTADIALSDIGDMFELAGTYSSSSNSRYLISTNIDGYTQERMVFTQFNDRTYPIGLDSTKDNGLIIIFNDYTNSDIIVIKIPDIDNLSIL